MGGNAAYTRCSLRLCLKPFSYMLLFRYPPNRSLSSSALFPHSALAASTRTSSALAPDRCHPSPFLEKCEFTGN